MFFLYSLLLTISFVFLLPRFFFDAVRKGKYAAGFWQRLGYLPKLPGDEKPIVWLHCVSVGETNAARPLVENFSKNFPNIVSSSRPQRKPDKNWRAKFLRIRRCLSFICRLIGVSA
jgi:3-deoxy-D-manno-octulosonic-acid transferase